MLDGDFLDLLRASFKAEADEHLQTIADGLIEIERSADAASRKERIASIFRAAHSLKGAAGAVELADIESACQALEDLFHSWRGEEAQIDQAAMDEAHHRYDLIVAAITPAWDPDSAREDPADATTPHEPTHEPRAASTEDTVRISMSKLDARLVEAEEMLNVKIITQQRSDELKELAGTLAAWQKAWASIEAEAGAMRIVHDRGGLDWDSKTKRADWTRILDFLDKNQEMLRAVKHQTMNLARAARQDNLVVGRLVDDLLIDSKKLLLLPFSSLSASYPKLVRDLSRDLDKDVGLTVAGQEIELDKRILEGIKDPLIHLLRNCLDHGVEPAAERRAAGKPVQASVAVSVTQLDGNNVEIVVRDDGRGIDAERVKASAVKQGVVTPEAARELTELSALDLIFHAEVSTSPIITRLSGRGLGMAIVREQAEKLGGSVTVESRLGRGTQFKILLPSTLATFRAVLVEVGRRQFVIPTAHVERVARVRGEEVKTVENKETIVLTGRTLALVRLADVLELAPDSAGGAGAGPYLSVVALRLGENRIAFVVDKVLDELEVLAKPLPKLLSRVPNIAGATVLGSGVVAPILNVSDLLKSARKAGTSRKTGSPATSRVRSLLIAEDSITSRMLLKGIFESAGYSVKTAVDGLEAFTLLRSEKFDLLVSDVEMPRLNGFDLTARIRADQKLADLPVVLVTARETREDRERGIDVGASAYINKTHLDQNNLLDAVRMLL